MSWIRAHQLQMNRSPNPSKPGKPIPVPMLWGNGTVDTQDAQRLNAFEHLTTVPPYVLGYEEPDCPSGEGSAGMSVEDGVAKWESLIAPLRSKGTKLGSPSMCSTSSVFESHRSHIFNPAASSLF